MALQILKTNKRDIYRQITDKFFTYTWSRYTTIL